MSLRWFFYLETISFMTTLSHVVLWTSRPTGLFIGFMNAFNANQISFFEGKCIRCTNLSNLSLKMPVLHGIALVWSNISSSDINLEQLTRMSFLGIFLWNGLMPISNVVVIIHTPEFQRKIVCMYVVHILGRTSWLIYLLLNIVSRCLYLSRVNFLQHLIF